MELKKLTEKDFLQIVPKNGNGFLTLSIAEQSAIGEALLDYSRSNNENIPEGTITIWIEDFCKRGFSLKEILFIIEKAKDVKKFGVTTWQTFIEAMQEENYLYNESDMLVKAREIAERIYENKLQSNKKTIEYENEAMREVKVTEDNLKEFIANQKYRTEYVNKAINKVLNDIEKCLEKNPYNYKTIIASERKTEN